MNTPMFSKTTFTSSTDKDTADHNLSLNNRLYFDVKHPLRESILHLKLSINFSICCKIDGRFRVYIRIGSTREVWKEKPAIQRTDRPTNRLIPSDADAELAVGKSQFRRETRTKTYFHLRLYTLSAPTINTKRDERSVKRRERIEREEKFEERKRIAGRKMNIPRTTKSDDVRNERDHDGD